jgi:hypothetical protein
VCHVATSIRVWVLSNMVFKVIAALKRPAPADIRGPRATRLNRFERDCASRRTERFYEVDMTGQCG